jgi:DNA-binding FrmR family transcriptional regulator
MPAETIDNNIDKAVVITCHLMEDSQECVIVVIQLYVFKKALNMVHSLCILQSYLKWHEDKEEKNEWFLL